MRFISVDLENSQPGGEIIQIGACAWDTDSGQLSSFMVYVDIGREVDYSYQLENGQTLGELLPDEFPTLHRRDKLSPEVALSHFWQWVKESGCGKKIIQWGGGDLEELIKESRQYSVRYPSHLRMLNLKTVYQFIYQPAMRLPKRFGLQGALQSLKLSSEGQPHDAYWDSFNTARLCTRIFNRIEQAGEIRNLIEKEKEV